MSNYKLRTKFHYVVVSPRQNGTLIMGPFHDLPWPMTYLSIITGSDGVSFLFPQDFFSQHRLEIQRWFFLFIIHRWRDSWNIDKGKLHLAGYKMCLMRFEWTSLEWPSNKSNKRLAKKLMGNISCCWGGKVYWS